MKDLSLKELVAFLDSELSLAAFPEDESSNGLQVEGTGRVRKVGVAVDAGKSTFKRASVKGVDFLFVHHGLIWGGIKSVKGILRERLKMLIDADMSLYACHLPLDWHPLYGNNARFLEVLSLKREGEFGEYHGKKIGYWGRAKREMSLGEFAGLVDKALDTRSTFLDFGRKVRNVGVVSGGGWSAIHDAEEIGIDTFLTGEPSHSAYSIAEELGVNLVFAGHYATETLGVKAVGEMLRKKFGIAVEFIHNPTNL